MTNLLKVNGEFSLVKLTISILLCLGVGALSSALSMGTMGAYSELKQPAFAPPSWIFGPVWTILYIMMGIAAYRIWMLGLENDQVRDALFFFGAQLVFNFMWTILFFRFELRGLAFLEIIILLVLIIITTVKFYKLDQTAGYLMIPYILWVSFASVLNYSIWELNTNISEAN